MQQLATPISHRANSLAHLALTRPSRSIAPSQDRRCEHDTGATRTAPYTVRPGDPFLGKRSRILAWTTRELARNSECSTPVRPFYGQGGHVVFPAPSGLNGQTKRSERRPAGRARRAPAPGAGPQWAPRVPWGANPKKALGMRIASGRSSGGAHFARVTYSHQLEAAAASPSLRRDGPSRPPGRPRLCPVAVHHEMDDADGLPLSSPLPLSPPAVQALIDNQDAPPSSESTGGDDDVDMEEPHRGGKSRWG